MQLGVHCILIFVSIIGVTNAQQQLDRNDGLTRYMACNRDAVVFHDEYGNKILDGRSEEHVDFEVHFSPSYKYGSKLYIEFCAKDIGCDQEKGLILCWEAPKWLKRNTSGSSNGRIKELLAQCGDYQGVMVTTVNGEDHFRVDTVHGSTYEFKVSTDPNCFALWLFGFDPYPGTREQLSASSIKKKRAVVDAWYPELRSRNALSLLLDFDGSNNGMPSEHPGDLHEDDRILDLSGKPVVMKDDEIQIAAEAGRFWPLQKGDFETHYFSAKFKAAGAGGCCNLTAKILGKQLSKCYFHWKDLLRCSSANAASDKCISNVQYGYNPKPLYGAFSMGSTTINVVSPTSGTAPQTSPGTETTDFSSITPPTSPQILSTTSTSPTANPKWIQYVTDPKNRTELEKQFGVYLSWNSAKYPAVARAAENLILERFSYAFPGYDDIGSFVTNELYDLRDAGRFELRPGKNANITIPPVNPAYLGEIRQVVFRCLGIQIDTNMYDFFDNSDGEKRECEAIKTDDGKPWPPVCDKK